MAEEKKHYLDELSDDLALTLGRAVWAFAEIEKLLFDYTKQLSKESDLNDLLGFQTTEKRVEIIKKLVNNVSTSDDKKQEATTYLEKVKELSRNRNLIAHNTWSIWIDFEVREFKTEIRANNNKKAINKREMIKFTQEADKLAVELQNSFIPLVKIVRGF